MLFSVYREEVMTMVNPSEEERQQYFKPLFYTNMLQKPKVFSCCSDVLFKDV